MRGSFSDWFVRVWCDRGSCDSPVRGSFSDWFVRVWCDSHWCAARSVIGLFVSGVIEGHVTLTGARLVHGSTRGPLVLVRVVALDAGQMRHAVVSSDHEDEAQHHAHAEVNALISHRRHHIP